MLLPIDHLPGSEADNGQVIKKVISFHLFFSHFMDYIIEKEQKRKVPVSLLHTVLCLHFPQTIVNPDAVGDEYTYRWYIKTAITRTPSKAKNQLEWIVKLAPKNQWAIHVLDHTVSFLSMLEADEGSTYTRVYKHTGNFQTHSASV